MKKDLTLIAIILDESGSMSSCKSDTIGGVNEFLNTQKKIKGQADVTLVKFSDYYKIINDATPIENVALLNEGNYTPSNSTALLDAVGKTFNSIGTKLANMKENERPEKVLVLIITDGYENASKEFSKKQIFDMVTHQREKYNWQITFIGADIAAWGEEIGIYTNVSISKDDIVRSMKGMSLYTANYRTNSANISADNFNLSSEELDTELEKMYEDKKDNK